MADLNITSTTCWGHQTFASQQLSSHLGVDLLSCLVSGFYSLTTGHIAGYKSVHCTAHFCQIPIEYRPKVLRQTVFQAAMLLARSFRCIASVASAGYGDRMGIDRYYGFQVIGWVCAFFPLQVLNLFGAFLVSTTPRSKYSSFPSVGGFPPHASSCLSLNPGASPHPNPSLPTPWPELNPCDWNS